jgi:hypothetical protein
MAAGCGHGTAIGHSLLSGGQFSVTFSRPVPVGQEFALQFTDLSNTSESAVVLKSVRISGRGVGTVAAVEHIAIVPWAKGNGGNALADTIYQTYPPAGTVRRGHCVRETPLPVRGYVLRPHAIARALVLIRLVRPGRLTFTTNTIRYGSDGHEYTQTLDRGVNLRVVAHGKPHAISGDERQCLALTKALPLGPKIGPTRTR